MSRRTGGLLTLALGWATCAAGAAGQNTADQNVRFNVAAPTLEQALTDFAAQANLRIVFFPETVKGMKASPLAGTYTPQDALKRLLAHSDLTYRFTDDRTVSISSAAAAVGQSATSTIGKTDGENGVIKMAQSEAGSDSTENTPANRSREEPASSSQTLAEVIVTAQKREERLLDVPVPVAVLSGEILTQTNQLRIQDYYHKIPGLNLLYGGDAQAPILAIRGITNGAGGAPLVGVVIDDIPYGSATGLGSRGQPSIDPGDLARVEVLRGPQGTLYGASSMGGLLKYVTIDPSTDKVSGRVEVGASSFFKGVKPGYDVRGSVNLPVNDTSAVRASAFKEQTPGYIKNIQTGQEGVNRRTSEGGRLGMLWKPSEDLSLKLSALFQHATRDGTDASATGPGLKDLQIRSLPNTYTLDEKTQAYSATLNAKLGNADLVSLTGFNLDRFHLVNDLAGVAGGYWTDCGGTPVSPSDGGPCGLSSYYSGVNGAELLESIRSRRFSQELRLSIPIGARVTWLLGGLYTDEKSDNPAVFSGADPVTGVLAPQPFEFLSPQTLKYTEYAAFTNLQYNITDQFDVQVGGRVSKNKQSFNIFRSGPAAVDIFHPLNKTGLHADDHPFTYLFTPRYKISPDLMIYARFASGYRPGGANTTCTTGIPCQFSAEKIKNYEAGLKGDFLDHALSVDASVYRINWTDIAVGVSNGELGYEVNVGKAKSQGVELSVEARPLQGLTVSAWVAWNDAQFTAPLPVSSGQNVQAGDRLPYGSRISGSVSADKDFVISGPLYGFVGGSVSYVGDRTGGIQYIGGPPRGDLPAYAQTDVHAGLKYQTWTFNAYVNNVTDKRGILAGGIDYQYQFPGYPQDRTYTYIQPRLFGLNAVKVF